jgi:predicted solute-binding protein
MKYYFPSNIFSVIIFKAVQDDIKNQIEFLPSASIAAAVSKDADSVGLIPTTDLLTHKDLLISSAYGISFEKNLCNSFLYFTPGQKDVKELYLYGDISSFEVILSKILFKELYNREVEMHLTSSLSPQAKNYLIAGDNNFLIGNVENGVSLSEQFIEMLSLPFVNYVFASINEDNLSLLNDKFPQDETTFYKDLQSVLAEFPFNEDVKSFIDESIGSTIFKFQQQDRDGVQQLLQLPYYFGITEEISEVSFI